MCLNHLSSSFSQERSDAFGERVVGAFNEAALCLMTSIGHRTGLFETLGDMESGTSGEIAERAHLNERYVREWLAAMSTARVVEYDASTATFRLPAEHARYLTRTGGADNLALYAQYIGMLGEVESAIVACFKAGGGVPYERYGRFHEVMAEDSGQTVVGALFDHILPLVPGLPQRLERGIRVLDAGCGSGRALALMAERYPRSHFVGVDLSDAAIHTARQAAWARGLGNVTFESRDLSDFDTTARPDEFDLITTFDAIHDQAKPRAVLKGIHRSLKADGIYLMQDIRSSSHIENNLDHPLGTLFYTISCMHCMSVSLAQGGEGLGTMWGREKARELLREAGFTAINVHELPHDIQNDYYIVQK